MSEDIKPIKSERIDNPDGSFILKEVFDDNPDGFLPRVIHFDKKERPVKIQEFYDKEFKELFITEIRKYDIFNNWVSDVIEENNSVWVKRYYKKGELIKEKRFDKESNKILSVKKYKYYKNGHYKIINKNYYQYSRGDVSTKEFNENDKLICEIYTYKGIKTKIFYEYKDGKIIEEKHYENNKSLISCLSHINKYKYDSQNRLIEEKTLVKDECTHIIKYDYIEDGRKIIYERFKNNVRIEGYSSIKIEKDKNDKFVYREYYKDREFKDLLYTEKTEYINNDNIKYVKLMNSQRNIKSYKNMGTYENTQTTYYEDENFEKIYAIETQKRNNLEYKQTIQLEKPLNRTFELYLTTYELSTNWLSCEQISPFMNSSSSYTFYAEKDFKNPVCYSKCKYLKDGNTTSFYNVYPKDNIVEVRKYCDNLIYKKQYKKFKFLAKLRYCLGI